MTDHLGRSETSLTIQNHQIGANGASYTSPKKGDPCQKCRKRPSTTQFTEGGALGLTHGFYQWRCDVCVLTEQLKHARERAKAIPELERKLRNAKRRKS